MTAGGKKKKSKDKRTRSSSARGEVANPASDSDTVGHPAKRRKVLETIPKESNPSTSINTPIAVNTCLSTVTNPINDAPSSSSSTLSVPSASVDPPPAVTPQNAPSAPVAPAKWLPEPRPSDPVDATGEEVDVGERNPSPAEDEKTQETTTDGPDEVMLWESSPEDDPVDIDEDMPTPLDVPTPSPKRGAKVGDRTVNFNLNSKDTKKRTAKSTAGKGIKTKLSTIPTSSSRVLRTKARYESLNLKQLSSDSMKRHA